MRLGSPTFFRQCRAKYGPVFKVAFGRTWMVVVAEPDLLRQVGTKLLNHSFFRGLMRGELQELDEWGLVSAKDDFWRLVRSAWQPAFSSASLAGYLPRMTACAEHLAGRMEDRARDAAADGAEDQPWRVDIWRELGAMTLQVVGSTAYGVDFQAMEGAPPPLQGPVREEEEPQERTSGAAAAAAGSGGGSGSYGRVLVEACRDAFKYSSVVYGSKYSRVSMLLPELRPLVRGAAHALPDRPFAKLLQARRNLRNTCVDLIASWRSGGGGGGGGGGRPHHINGATANGAAPPPVVEAEAVGQSGSGAGADTAFEGAKPPAVEAGSFLGLMLSARDKATGQGLNDRQVAAQVQTFILAGYETTANALAFTVYCLGVNPEVEARLLAEVDEVVGPDRLPTAADLPRLVYTEAVFNEAMRLYPPAHATNRHVEGGPIQVGGYTVPPGIPVFMSIFSSHHNPDVWPRVNDFIPERFLPESPLHPQVAARVPGAHAPFGYGSRMCIGWKFAVQEAKIALATLYRRLRFELEPGQVPLRTAVGITLSPRDGVWVRPVLRV
ncbi:hypothetical protein GPECTOR_4g739 [Gonium pectorale]|uniref:Cytochrome P450 n=1 Tax=Gonium pectorale TaxID=33097 RepID=A0A150GY46_GONPE|nr:hypothetical protein GPECTOR_4g739 [Gonium pectorale]|eukprot:KXZ54673.1 hypothetical protein GPECTOR_4g739 [Gonium pectorale]